MNDFRDRVVLPVGVPLACLAFIGTFVFAFSRILLAAPGPVAIAAALAMAVDVLLVGAMISNRREGSGSPLYIPLLAVSALAVLGGGAYAMRLPPPGHGGEATTELHVVAKDLKFDPAHLTAPAGAEVVIDFDNQDTGQLHNISIFTDEAMTTKLLEGELITGPDKATYTFTAPGVGTYHFHCDVHPTMTGDLEVVAAAAGGAGAPAESGVPIKADALKFDKAELQLPAGGEAEIVFNNAEAVPHNVSIYGDESLAQKIFVGEQFSGPGKRTYTFKAPPPGTYYFQCDIHPPMKGKVTVA